jgi:hypothetical protein
MNKTEYIAFAEAEMNRVLAMVKQKNSDYTGGTECTDPFANFTISTDFGVPPLTGLCIRMADKFQRVKTFCRDGKMAQSNEGAVDAFRDIIGYSLIALGMLEELAEVDNWDITVEDAMADLAPQDEPHVAPQDTISLKVGGVYRNRLGEERTIMEDCGEWVCHPFTDGNRSYRADGNFINSSPHDFDLVEVVSEPQADLGPQDEPQVAPPAAISLKVGGYYRDRRGVYVVITGVSNRDNPFPFSSKMNGYYSDCYYTASGKTCNPCDKSDLVEVVCEPQEDA